MAAVYPGSVRVYTAKTDLVDTVFADHVNLLQDEVTAIQQTLGAPPSHPSILASTWSGSFSTPASHTSLSNRLVNIEAGITSILSSKQDAATAVTLTGSQTLTNKSISGSTNTLTNISQSSVTNLTADLAAKAPLASPALTGTPTAPTQSQSDNSTKLATTAYVRTAITDASVADGSITSAKLASGAVFNVHVNSAAAIDQSKIANLTTDLASKANLSGATFTGAVSGPTAAVGTNTTQFATTAFVNSEIANDAILKTGGTLTGTIQTSGSGKFQGLGAITICTSTTRPASPSAGQVIYETDTTLFFGWNGTYWLPVGGGAKGSNTDDIFYENSKVVTSSYTITSGKNAGTFGPVTINSGVTVTVPSGSVWTVV